jgi:hypothetical protein
MIKSSFMLIEVMFSINQNDAQAMIVSSCVSQQYQVVSDFMTSLNTDIMALNNSLV